jgi:hypothetical protein
MATAWNDVTGARLVSRANNKNFNEGFARIMDGEKPVEEVKHSIYIMVPRSKAASFTVAMLAETCDVIESQIDSESVSEVRVRLIRLWEKTGEQRVRVHLSVNNALKDRIAVIGMTTSISQEQIAAILANFYVVAHAA